MQIGERLEECTMKKTKVNNLRLNKDETKKIKEFQSNAKSVKITINIDSNTFNVLKKLSNETGIPYQRLLNKFLRESIQNKTTLEDRIEKVENELAKVKKKLAA